MLLVIHLAVGDLHPALVILHMTMPVWSALAVLGLFLAVTSRVPRFVGYAFAIVSLFHLYRVWLPMFDGNNDPGVRSARVVMANLYVANGSTRPMLGELGAIEADVLILLEVDDRWRKAIRESEWYGDYPYRHDADRNDAFGISMLSRIPLRDKEVLTVADIPALAAVLRVDDREVRLLGVHAAPPISAAGLEANQRQLRGLRTWIDQPGLPPVAAIGDFNLSPWNPSLEAFAAPPMRLGHRRLGALPWPTWRPKAFIPGFEIPVAPLDHAVVEDRVRVHRSVLSTGRGSDHRPIVIDISW